MCLDFAKFQDKIEIFGSSDSDDTQFLELTFLPCKEEAPSCRVKSFRNEEGLMQTEALWDELGMLEIEILSLQQRMD